MGSKTANKQERQRRKRAQERMIKIDSQKRPKFWLLRMHEKQKSSLIMSCALLKKYAFFLAKPIFSHSYAN